MALLHPGGGDAFAELHDKVGVWLVVHLAELVLSLALAAVFWTLLTGRAGSAVTVCACFSPDPSRVLHRLRCRGRDRDRGWQGITPTASLGTNELAPRARLTDLLDNRVAGSFSVVGFIASVALVVVVVAVAMVLRSAGGSLWAFGLMLLGVLLVAHSGLPGCRWSRRHLGVGPPVRNARVWSPVSPHGRRREPPRRHPARPLTPNP